MTVVTIARRMRRTVRNLGLALLVTGAGIGGYCAYLQWSGNFHEVIADELYRSAQPSPRQMEAYVRDKGIRTIVNLRGRDDKSDWYRQEIETAKSLGVEHIDFKMSSSEILTSDRAQQLIGLLRDAPKPILVHCRSGSDRTGLVSVIYSHQIAGVDEHTAERQLSLFFGHIGIPFLSPTFAMDESWEKLEHQLPQEARSGTPTGVIEVR